jgi:hypothetical protein
MEQKTLGLVKVVEQMRNEAWELKQASKTPSGMPSITSAAINYRNVAYKLETWAKEIELQGDAVNRLLEHYVINKVPHCVVCGGTYFNELSTCRTCLTGHRSA